MRALRFLPVLALVIAIATDFGVAVTAPHAAPRPVSVKDSPGYVPLVDPESASVVLGRRTNAPLVSVPFRGGSSSLKGLARDVCRHLHRADQDSLRLLLITDTEFRDVLWREFPQSRPATGLQWEDGWRSLYSRILDGTNRALKDYGNHWYQVVSVRADSVARYRNFTLHSRLVITVKDDQGQTQEWRWLRAVAERKGRFKIYSTDD